MVLIIAVVFLMCITAIGTIRYNTLRRNWYGIIGLPGAFLSMFGVMILVMLVGEIVQNGFGFMSDGGLFYVILLVVAILYMVKVMLTKCHTAAQRIMLPFVAILMTFGFCVRLIFSVLIHMPMSDGSTSKSGFPTVLFDDQENEFRLQSDSGDHADYYCSATGESRQFWEADFQDAGLPFGWRVG